MSTVFRSLANMTAHEHCSIALNPAFYVINAGAADIYASTTGELAIDCNTTSSALEGGTGPGVLYGAARSGDFTWVVKLAGTDADENTEASGLVYWLDSGNFVSLTRGYIGGVERINLKTRIGSTTTYSNNEAAAWTVKYLKLQRVGNVFSAWYSDDGESWTQTGSNRTVALSTTGHVGVLAETNNGSGDFVSYWDEAELDGTRIPFVAARLGFYNASSDTSGTGLTDLTKHQPVSIALASGTFALQSAASNDADGILGGPGSMNGDDPYLMIPEQTDGDFTVRCYFADYPAGDDDAVAMMLGFRVDDNDYAYVMTGDNSTDVTLFRKVIDGALTTVDTGTVVAEKWWQLDRTANVLSLSYADNIGDLDAESGTYTLFSSTEQAYADGYAFIANAAYNANGNSKFDDFYFKSGFAGAGLVTVHDAGSAYMDAGLTRTWDRSSFSIDLHNAATGKVYVYESNSAGDTPGDEDYTEYASLTAFTDSAETVYRYMWMRIEITEDGDDPSLLSVTGDTVVADVTPPSDVSSTATYSVLGDTTDLFLAWNDGTDTGTGYKGAYVAYQVDGVYYYEQTDGSWSDTLTDYKYRKNENGAGRCATAVSGVSGTIAGWKITTEDNSANTNVLTGTFLSSGGMKAPCIRLHGG